MLISGCSKLGRGLAGLGCSVHSHSVLAGEESSGISLATSLLALAFMAITVTVTYLLLRKRLAGGWSRAIARDNRQLLRVLERSIQSSVNGVVIADTTQSDYPIVFVNDAFTRITGYDRAELIGKNCRILQGEETDPAVVRAIRLGLEAERELHLRVRNYRKDGTPFWNELHLSPVRDHRDRLTHYVGIQHDVSDQVAYEQQLAHDATHDSLTGLPNRSLLEEHLKHDFAMARRHGHTLTVMFVDLDEFKPINDTLGHDVGDAVLQEVATRLLANARAGDTVCRLGGDEFVLLMPCLPADDEAPRVAERILRVLSRPYEVQDMELRLTASVGVATADQTTRSGNELIQQADMAMYKAKRKGRNHTHFYTPEINAKLSRRLTLRSDLQEAIEQEQLLLHYQPIYDRSGEVVCFEGLLRWNHPVRGQIPPGKFIPLAESTGQIIPISRWVLEQACRDLQWLESRGLGEARIAANLSPLQFHRPNFVSDVRSILRDSGVNASRLELELTEGILMGDAAAGIDSLCALREMGIGVSIDDFGTGYSSLSYLKKLPISKVKMDRSFVAGLASEGSDSAIVQATIAMAHHLQLGVVGEGVERREQWRCLRDFGCDFFQGYWLARPAPREQMPALSRISSDIYCGVAGGLS